MTVQYQGNQNGIESSFEIKIIAHKIARATPRYKADFFIGNSKIPTMTSKSHHSIQNCLKEVYLFRKANGIELDSNSEKLDPLMKTYELVQFNYNKIPFLLN